MPHVHTNLMQRKAEVERHEFLGRPLESLTTVSLHEKNYRRDIPLILYMMHQYFSKNNRLATKKIFRLNGDLSKIEKLRVAMGLGDYQILEREYKDYPIEVAVFYKEILLELLDPVFPFKFLAKLFSDQRFLEFENPDAEESKKNDFCKWCIF